MNNKYGTGMKNNSSKAELQFRIQNSLFIILNINVKPLSPFSKHNKPG
jgi:hypothetical protein